MIVPRGAFRRVRRWPSTRWRSSPPCSCSD